MCSGSARKWTALVACGLVLTACEREQREFHGPSTPSKEHYVRNAYDVAQGKRLFQWMNCSGCHAHGGGGIGPALSDRYWLYGGTLAQIHDSIRDGRPNGMPAWGTRLPDDQIWQISAYIRSLSGNVRKDVAPSRDDALNSGRAENRREQLDPVAGRPPR